MAAGQSVQRAGVRPHGVDHQAEQGGKPDRLVMVLALVLAVSVVGFAGYYYYDRYYHVDEKAQDREMRAVEEMVQKNPQNPDLRVAVATYYLDAGGADAAVLQAEEALKINPQHQGAILLLGQAYERNGDPDRAISQFEQIVAMNQDSSLAKLDKRLGMAYYELGNLYASRGRFDEAVARLKLAIEIDRTDADAHTALGTTYQKMNDHQNAVVEFQQALRFDPYHGPSYQGLAASYAAQGDTKKAAYAQAMVAFANGKPADAASQLEALTAQSPDLTQVYLGLGLSYEKLGKRDQAISALHKYISANPDDIAANQALSRLSRGTQ
jgi:tetratricopeptide (TPR) repeat protein